MIRRVAISALALACLWLTNFSWIYGVGYQTQTYYLSPTGNDSNNGTSPATAWLSPNHSVNCGDILIRAAGVYNSSNFTAGKWGTVANCPSSNGYYFAQMQCAGPFVSSCSIADTSLNGMLINKSNWAVIGGSYSSTVGACISAAPTSAASIHHIAIVNAICDGAKEDGFNSYTYNGGQPQFGVDYFAVVGAIVHNAAQASSGCYSGVSVYEPANVDTASGTHIFVAGVFSFGNIDPNPCGGGAPTDGQGIDFDNWSHSQQTGNPFTGQGVIEQSMALGNGASAINMNQNTAALVFIQNNTGYGDYQDTHHQGTFNGEITFNGNVSPGGSTAQSNIFQASVATVNSNAVYAAFAGLCDATNVISGNYLFGVGGNNTQSNSCSGFSFGANTTATPNFVNPVVPVAVPDSGCVTDVTTTACMVVTIANFTAQAVGAAGLGYQPPSACAPDALFPVWLKGIIPNGIITKPCGM